MKGGFSRPIGGSITAVSHLWSHSDSEITLYLGPPSSARRTSAMASRWFVLWTAGGPGRDRTYDQGIHSPRRFRRKWTISSPSALPLGRGTLSPVIKGTRATIAHPSGSLCTFRRCTAGLAQGYRRR